MNIIEVMPLPAGKLHIVAADGRSGILDMHPFLEGDAFGPLKNAGEFAKVRTHGYFVEWDCGADLSADTIEARWVISPATDIQKQQMAQR